MPTSSRVALVTGSTAGIGKAIAKQLARCGYRVILNSRVRDYKAEQALAEVRALSPASVHVAADVSSLVAVRKLRDEISGLSQRVDVLVNNAGLTSPTSIREFDEGQWRRQFDENFFSTVFVIHSFLDLVHDACGAILNVSSIRGIFENGRQGIMAYSAAKAALNSLTRTLAKELAPTVTVNAILPGFTATEYLGRVAPAQIEAWSGISPIKRFIAPEEIAEFAAAIISNRSLTGGLFVADGGFTLRPEP